MGKEKNHTARNQSAKNHRNGIKKPTRHRYHSLKGMDPKFLRNLRFSKKHNHRGFAKMAARVAKVAEIKQQALELEKAGKKEEAKKLLLTINAPKVKQVVVLKPLKKPEAKEPEKDEKKTKKVDKKEDAKKDEKGGKKADKKDDKSKKEGKKDDKKPKADDKQKKGKEKK